MEGLTEEEQAVLERQRLMFGESLQSVKRRAPVVELGSGEQAKRGKAKTVKPKDKRLKTLRQWAAAHKHYTKGDLKNKANLQLRAVGLLRGGVGYAV